MPVLVHIIVPADDAFQQIFQNIKLFTETVTLYFEPTRLFIQTMDTSHVSVVECVLPNTWFQSYAVERSTKISLNVALFSKVINTREKFHNIVLQLAPDSDSLTIVMQPIENKDEAFFQKMFDIPLFDMDTELLQIPDTEYDAEFALKSNEFAELIKQLQIFGDSLDIECSESDIVLNSVSQDKGKMRCTINIEQLSAYSILEDGVVKMSFALSYLSHICAFHKLAPRVNIDLKTGSPIRITYDLNKLEGVSSDAHLRFYLAPKIGDNDDD